ncbi:MAG: phospholipase A [Campylobacteraceae bacterium]|jgi:phospholipase A1|nr:phospholipase A [Campylobacteraceae bacterium]
MKKYILFLCVATFLFANEYEGLKVEALNGNKTAAFKLAAMYENEKDFESAMYWYKEAAKSLAYSDYSDSNGALEEALSQNSTLPAIQTAITYIKNSEKIFSKYSDEYGDIETKNNVFQLMSSVFGLMPYRSTYFLPTTYNFKSYDDGRKHFETAFQISLKKDIFENLFGFDEKIGVAYTQRSWWQITENSAPFRETNYLPEIYVDVPLVEMKSFLKGFQFGYLHESNGQGDSLGISRSWNRLYLEGYFQFSGMFFVPRVWYGFDIAKDNQDIEDYIGHGDLNIVIPYKRNLFKMTLRNNFDFSDNHGAAQVDWTFPIFDTGLFGYLQYFYGYGESLIDYNRKTNRVGLGIAFTR